jgi:hypothetical protein
MTLTSRTWLELQWHERRSPERLGERHSFVLKVTLTSRTWLELQWHERRSPERLGERHSFVLKVTLASRTWLELQQHERHSPERLGETLAVCAQGDLERSLKPQPALNTCTSHS